MIYLYVKTHNKTGLKYLGKTTAKDPHKYAGSGKYWKNHLEEHGHDYITEILLKTENEEELKQTGKYFSKLFNITESNEWANLKDEENDGGWNIQHIMMEKHKVKFVMQSSKFKNAQKTTFQTKFNGYPLETSSALNAQYKETLMANYGVDNPMKSSVVKERYKTRIKQKYNVDHISKSKIVKEKKTKTFKEKYNGYKFETSSALNAQYKETLMANYGVDNPMKSSVVKEKAKETLIAKYGVDNISKLESIKEKKTKTNLHKFGSKHPNKGRIIITNGTTNKFSDPLQIPAGWWKGKTNIKKD